MARAKVTIEMENGFKQVLEFDEFEMVLKRHIKAHDNKVYTLGNRHAILHGWLISKDDENT